MGTFFQKKEEAEANRRWVIVDAAGVSLGRLATEVANLIRGKDQVAFTPHVDGGAFVVVVNAAKIKLTGQKKDKKLYYHHTGYVGGLKEIPAGKILESHPERLIEKAVRGMLPKKVLGHRLRGKLKVYPGAEHPHSAQSPKVHNLSAKAA